MTSYDRWKTTDTRYESFATHHANAMEWAAEQGIDTDDENEILRRYEQMLDNAEADHEERKLDELRER